MVYGSFFLGKYEFALPAKHVQEVVNNASSFAPVPLAPPFLKGLVNLRGMVIPVIDLNILLQIKHTSETEPQKIAIVEKDGLCVGFLFDQTAEVFRSTPEERSDFTQQGGPGIISGVFKKDNGKRLVQILDVENIFKLQNIQKDNKANHNDQRTLKKRGPKQQCISFDVGPAKCALSISAIQEILKVDQLNDSLLDFGNCIGTLELRGTTVPVVDFAAVLKYRHVERTEFAIQDERRIIVLRLGPERFGLLVDSVDSIIKYFPDELVKFSDVDQSRSPMFLGCLPNGAEQEILLLDQNKILSDTEIIEMTRGHSNLYQSKPDHSQVKNKGSRQTYITFRIGAAYAVPMGEVKEIIKFPKNLLQPPGMMTHVNGVLNLRGELIPIIDTRILYSQPATDFEKIDLQKVLILKQKENLFGIIVDSVESIIAINENEKLRLPELTYRRNSPSIVDDILEAVEVTDTQGTKQNLLILNIQAISQRAGA